MSEYIGRESIRKSLMEVCSDENCPMFIAATIDQVIDYEPAADVAPVVHGKWYYNENGRDFGLGAWACSCCDTCNHNIPGNPNMNPYIWSGSKFCPNCGAKMDGGVKNDG